MAAALATTSRTEICGSCSAVPTLVSEYMQVHQSQHQHPLSVIFISSSINCTAPPGPSALLVFRCCSLTAAVALASSACGHGGPASMETHNVGHCEHAGTTHAEGTVASRQTCRTDERYGDGVNYLSYREWTLPGGTERKTPASHVRTPPHLRPYHKNPHPPLSAAPQIPAASAPQLHLHCRLSAATSPATSTSEAHSHTCTHTHPSTHLSQQLHKFRQRQLLSAICAASYQLHQPSHIHIHLSLAIHG